MKFKKPNRWVVGTATLAISQNALASDLATNFLQREGGIKAISPFETISHFLELDPSTIIVGVLCTFGFCAIFFSLALLFWQNTFPKYK